MSDKLSKIIEGLSEQTLRKLYTIIGDKLKLHSGYSSKDFRRGDIVWFYNKSSGEKIECEVKKTPRGNAKTISVVTISGGESWRISTNYLFKEEKEIEITRYDPHDLSKKKSDLDSPDYYDDEAW